MEKRRDILDSKGLEIRLVGIILGLISLIGLLNLGPIGNFIYFCLGYCLGIFAYVPLIIVLVVSLSLIIRKCSLKKSNPFFIAGIIVFLVGLAISCSNSKSLNMSTLKTNFEYAYNTADISLFNIPSFISLTSLKGGIIGYFFAALFNTALTYIGTIVLYSVLLFVGVVLMLFYPIRYIVENIETKIYQKKGLKSEILHINKPQFVEEVVEQKELYREKEDSLDQEDNVTFIPYGKTYQSPGVVPTKVKFHNEDNKDSVTSSDKKDDDRPILSIEEYKDNRSNITIQIENRDDFLCDNIIKNEDANEDSNNFIADENIQDIALSESFKQFVDKTFSHQAPTPIVKGEEAIIDEFEPVSASLLNDYEDENVLQQNEQSCFEREKIINQLFVDFGVGAQIQGHVIGPSVTRFNVQTNRNVSVKDVAKYIDDISIRLGGISARFVKVVKGSNMSGLEIPNFKSSTVSFKECISKFLNNRNDKYIVPLGKEINGDICAINVTDFPHLLVAGATGSGKSIFIHDIIMSLIMKTSPQELKIMLIDPKRVEFSQYKGMPHLICPIITECDQARVALKKIVDEMEKRYVLFEKAGVSKISQYNKYALKNGLQPLETLVVIVDEYANLVEASRGITDLVVKIVQKSRAAGIHMVIATQRPSVNVITGVIKGNLPSRVALRTASATDSTTILGEGGAESLLGYGDMLFDSPELGNIGGFARLQCPYIDNDEIKRVVEFLKQGYQTKYDEQYLDLTEHLTQGSIFGNKPLIDENYEEVKQYVYKKDETSISDLQINFGFGYPRAAKIFNQLQTDGIVSQSSANGTKGKRKVLKHFDENE